MGKVIAYGERYDTVEAIILYNLEVLGHFFPRTHFDLRVLRYFVLKNQTKKSSKSIKIFELYQVFMHNFLYQNFQIFQNYILLTRKINTLWCGGISSIRNTKSLCTELL